MRLVLIRHGIAEEPADAAANGKADARRPLTKNGKRKMRRAAKRLHAQFPEMTLLGCSPLIRAVETAQIVADAYEGLEVMRVPALTPKKSPQELIAWVQSKSAHSTIGLVGHEPGMSIFASWLLTGLQESFITLKKGSACVIDLDGEIKAGHGKLFCLLQPRQLRTVKS